MAKSKRSRRVGKKKIPLAIMAPLAAQGMYIASVAMESSAPAEKASKIKFIMTGVDDTGRFHSDQVIGFYGTILAGVLIHKGANYLGLNRAMSSVPLVNI